MKSGCNATGCYRACRTLNADDEEQNEEEELKKERKKEIDKTVILTRCL
jgi:hypothetical protein